MTKDYTAEDLQNALDRGREIGRREALAQPEQEPFAWADLNALSEQINSVNCGTVYRLPSEAENRQPLYTAPQQHKPNFFNLTVKVRGTNQVLDITGLYNDTVFVDLPRQRKPLTDEQIAHATAPVFMGGNPSLTGIARAIEAAHGIKENS